MSEEWSNGSSAKPASDAGTEQDVGGSASADPFEERRERRAERRGHRHDATPWLGGVILIVLGLIFLAQNFGIATLNNWWAIFILIPAVGAFTAAWRRYQAVDQVMTSGAVGSLIGGLVLTAVALAFLFNLGLNAGVFWPLLLIIGGVAVLLQAVSK